jgi:HEAT repeat protein
MEALRKFFAKRGEHPHQHPISSTFAELGDEGFSIIMKSLADPDRGSRRLRANAALATRLVGERCLDATYAQLKSPKRELRQAACAALYHNRSERSVQPLSAVLRDPKSGVSREAADALAALGRPAVAELISAAGSVDLSVVTAAVGVMAKVRDHRLLPVLKKLLAHKAIKVRTAAVFGMGHQYHNDAMPAVMAMLKDPEPKVREAALAVLERNTWARSYVPQARAALKDDSVIVRRKAAYALRALGDASAIPDLQTGLRGEKDKNAVRAMEVAIDSINRAEERRKKQEAKRLEREKAEAERRKQGEERRKAEEDRRKQDEERQKAEEERRRREEEERRRREQEKREKEDPGDEEPL